MILATNLSDVLGMGLTASGYLSCDGFDAFASLYSFLSLALTPFIWTSLPSLQCQAYI